MKKHITATMAMLALAGVYAIGAEATGHETCCVLSPDASALEARAEADSFATDAAHLGLFAAKKKETRLDVVDILVAFDKSAMDWLEANGKGTSAEYAASCIDKMNYCLAESEISEFKFRLAGCVSIDEDASGVPFAYILQNNLIDVYGAVVASNEWKKITDKRESTGADIVSILVATGGKGMVGLGYGLQDSEGSSFSQNPSLIPHFGDWAYNCCSIESVDVDYTMAHEVGHNMGCGHPDETLVNTNSVSPGPQLYEYSAGYYIWSNDIGYYTVMAYNHGGVGQDGLFDDSYTFAKLPCFSSPLLKHEGIALGSEINDNRRTLLDTYKYVAQYRVSTGAIDDGGQRTDEPTSSDSVFQTAYCPAKAVNAAAPYVGAAYSGEEPVYVVQLKCGKANAKKNVSKVSATVIDSAGKKYGSGSALVQCGKDATAVLAVKKLGTLSLVLGGEGFAGKLSVGGVTYDVKTAEIGGSLASGSHFLAVKDFSMALDGAKYAGYEMIADTVPSQQPFAVSGKKWNFGKNASIAYKKFKDPATKAVSYVAQWTLDHNKVNYSNMNVAYNPKTGIFKGSFKVCASNAATVADGKPPKVAKFTVKLTGFVVDGVGYGAATLAKPNGTWRVTVE